MGCVSNISTTERLRAYASAVDMAATAIKAEDHYVSPEAKIGSLSAYEWDKLVNAIVSGWIIERSRQLVADRIDEAAFLATGQTPEPYEVGVCAAVLGPLGDLVEKAGLTTKPIGEWSKWEICMFLWTATELVIEARQKRDERPDAAEIIPFPPEMMAG